MTVETDGPNWLIFVARTLGYPGCKKGFKKFNIFESPLATPGTAKFLL